ncbi:MAG TPA: AAA family ATPase [Terrimicrobiaceae bacterium]|nr:AAA family ATPase [Terrimicrobiaceae bacterium]
MDILGASPLVAEPPEAPKVAVKVRRKGRRKVAMNLSGFSIRRPGEILEMEFKPEDRFLENGVFSRGQSLTILGPGGVGKSRLVLQMAVSTILGRDCLGMKVNAKGLKWLVLQTENSNFRLQADVRALKNWIGEENWKVVDNQMVLHTLENQTDSLVSLKNPKVVEKIAGVVKEVKADVVVFDPLAAYAVGSLTNDAGMTATCQAITEIVRKGAIDSSLVILHHTLTGQKGAQSAFGADRASYGRGSKVLQGWTRGQINISARSKSSNGLLLMSCGKNSNGPEFDPIGLRLNPLTMISEVDPEFDLAAWKEETGLDDATRAKINVTDLAGMVRKKPMKRSALVTKIVSTGVCQKATAYTLVKQATGKTIRVNEKGELVAM